MAFSANREQTLKFDSTDACCDQWKKKYLKVQESRNALRQAVKVLELKINELQANNKKVCEANIETQKKLEEVNARVSLENETCSFKSQFATPMTQEGHDDSWDGNENKNLQGLLADREKEIDRLKEILEAEKRRAATERKNENENLKGLLADREREIGRLKEFLEAEKRRAGSERKNENEKLQGLLADKEKEIGRLKELLEAEKRMAGSERKNENENKNLQGLLTDREREIGRLKELLEAEKRRAGSERKEVAEACKLLEEEKKKAVERGEIARIEAEKAEEYRIQISRLEKQGNEVKVKLASEMSAFKETTKKYEAEKRKILAEKRNAELGMAKAYEKLEVEKLKADEEKRRTDAEMAKFEEQKVLAEDNWCKFMKEKDLAAQMSQQLEEDKQMIEDLKQKIHELSSLREPIESAADINMKAESTKVKLLKNKLKIEKLRRKKYKLAEIRYGVLRHELCRLKVDFIQHLRRLDIMDASLSPVLGSIHDQTQSENILDMQNLNVLRQVCNQNLSQMHRQFENELLDPSFTTTDASDSLGENMQPTPLLGLSGGNYSECITGIDSKLEPLVRGSNITKLQSSAVNSSTESFSDGQLMGSQETTTFPVTASAQLTQEIFNARQSMCNPSDRFVTVNHRERKRMHDTVEYIENLSSKEFSDLRDLLSKKVGKCLEGVTVNHREQKRMHDTVEYVENLSSEEFSDLRDLLNRKVGKCQEGGREMLPSLNNLQEKNSRAHKKIKKSDREKVDMIPGINRDEKRGTEEANTIVYDDANTCRHTSCPASYTLETTQACRGMICNAANDFDSLISFDTVADGSYMKLLELENATNEECYRRAMDFPLSPLPEIELHETFGADNSMNPFLEEALQEDMLSSRTDLFPSPSFDVFNVEITSNKQKIDVSEVSYNSQNGPTDAGKTEVVKLPHMHNPDDARTTFVGDGIGSLHNRLPEFCVVFSNIEDKSVISRILIATKNCIKRCNLATQTGWAVRNILAALKMGDKLSQMETVSVLFTLLLFNFTVTTTKTFGKLWDGSLFHCLKSYAEHICTVLSSAETRNLFVGNDSLHELLGIIKDFLIEGKVIVLNKLDVETLSDCDLRASDFLDCVNKISSDVASSEQLVAGSVILASVCAATDHVGFICEASYDVLRLCKWDSSIVLTILHIFAYLGGEKFFELDDFGLMVTVLKSLVMFLEGGILSDATGCLPSINQMHSEFCTKEKCPFLEGAESVDVVASLLLEEIKNCWLQNSRFMSDSYNAGKCCNQEAVRCSINKNFDVPWCLKKCLISAPHPDVLCHLGDVVSLVELVANKMSWHWTEIKLVPQLLNMLDSCAEENFAIAVIALLGQFGRIGIDVVGYEDQGVGNLRCYFFAYLSRTSSMKAGLSPLQIATATALFDLLPLDLESLFHTGINLQAYSESVSDNAETLRKWFSGLGKDQQELLSAIFKCSDVYNK